MPDHRVEVVIVNYNSGEYLARAIKSLMQHHQKISAVVVDNHSVDRSLDGLKKIAGKNQHIRLIVNDSNRGFSAANNQVLLDAGSDCRYWLIMNPDCEIQAGTLDCLTQVMDDDESIATSGCLIRNSDGTVQDTCKRKFPTPFNSLARMIGLNKLMPTSELFSDFNVGKQQSEDPVEVVEALSGAFMLLRADIVHELGGLDEQYFMHCEDLDWCKRVTDAGYKNVFVGDVEVIHHKGISTESNPLSVNRYLHDGMWKFYAKHYREKYPRPVMWLVYLGINARLVAKSINLYLAKLKILTV